MKKNMTMSFPTRSRRFCRLNDLTMRLHACTALPRQVVPARALMRSFNQQNGGGRRRRRVPAVPKAVRLEALVSDDHAVVSISLEAAASRHQRRRPQYSAATPILCEAPCLHLEGADAGRSASLHGVAWGGGGCRS
ncbi:hypothetical protein VPH35_135087 [Triticum aestivum]